MRIHVLSDIHLEFGKFKHEPPECDVVILSGDIGVGAMACDWARKFLPGKRVVWVPGNHEFYGRIMDEELEHLRDSASKAGIDFLYNDTVVIDGVRFIGATMWTDFNLHGKQPIDMNYAQNGMNDYRKIQKRRGWNLRAEDTLNEHQQSRLYLMDELAKPFEGKTVVVTHHAPTELSIVERYKFSELSPAYASRLEEIMFRFEPVLWTHGHVHSSLDYMVGNTRVVCNPRGYVGHELNPGFDPKLVVTI